MVVENPIPADRRESLERAVAEVLGSGSTNIKETSTAEGAYDYTLIVTQTQTMRMRTVKCKVKWHDDLSDWEVTPEQKGPWRS